MNHWRDALKGIALADTPVFVKSDFPAKMIIDFIQQFFQEYHLDLKRLSGGIFFEPMAKSISHQDIRFNRRNYYRDFTELNKWLKDNAAEFSIFNHDATVYHNAGANAVQELAFVMAAAVESIRQMQKHDNEPVFSTYTRKVDFNFSVGSNFFIEIAKLRAARILWHTIAKAFDENSESKIRIHAETSQWNKTVLDEHTNILRTTTEAFSAIIGGCDSLQIQPFNSLSNQANVFSERVARNIHLVLRDEAHSGKTIDAAGGSWYVESLTQSLAEKAWALFQDIEQRGGMLSALQDGFVEQTISDIRDQRIKDVETRRKRIIGANIYPNLKDKRFGAENKSPRAAKPFEDLRLQLEAYASKKSRPKVLLLNYGGVHQYKPRADFARGFFEVAGFEVHEKTVNPDIDVNLDSKPKIVTLCSSDALYPEFVPTLAKKLKAKNKKLKLLVAGNPTDHIQAFKRAGVNDFIHIKSNVFEMLSQLMEETGIL